MGDHSYADVVKFGDKNQNNHVGDHSYACTMEESGALHNKNNEKINYPHPQIEKGDTQDCVIEDGIFHDNLSKNSDRTNDKQNMSSKLVQLNQLLIKIVFKQLVLADIKNLPSQLTYVDNNPFLRYSVPGDGNSVFFIR